MGIPGFRHYVEHVIRRPSCFVPLAKEKALQTAIVGDEHHEKGGDYFEDVAVPYVTKKARGEEVDLVVDDGVRESRPPRLGLYVDLNSLLYGILLKEITSVGKFDDEPTSDNEDASAAAADPTACLVYSTETPPPPPERANSRKRKRSPSPTCPSVLTKEDLTYCKDATNDVVYCQLSEVAVELLSTICAKQLFYTLNRWLYASYRVFLAWDTYTTTAKTFEQTVRRSRQGTVTVARQSRLECFSKTAAKFRSMVIAGLRERFARRFPNEAATYRDRRLDDAYASLVDRQMSTAPSSSSYGHQRFAVGESEWKCFYQIHDDVGYVDNCFVFGNDWDIALGVLLYDSSRVRDAHRYQTVAYVCTRNEVFTVTPAALSRVPPGNSETTVAGQTDLYGDAERGLHVLFTFLVGNDYIFKLVNESKTNLVELGRQIKAIVNASEPCCTTLKEDVVELLYGGRDIAVPYDAKSLTKSLAYMYARALFATYACYDKRADTVLTAEWASDDIKQGRLTGSLQCRDERRNPSNVDAAECISQWVRSVLWYVSYVIFYKYACEETKSAMRYGQDVSGPGSSRNVLLDARLPNGRTFSYDDPLMEVNRFTLAKLLELKKVVRENSIVNLYRTLRHSFDLFTRAAPVSH